MRFARLIAGVLFALTTLPVAHSAPQRARLLVDPHSGRRWILLPDPRHPGGPGRLVSEAADGGESTPKPVTKHEGLAVIRAGERVRVEDRTPVALAVLDGIALNAAASGQPLRVRLSGGTVIWAVAAAPGRAQLAAAVAGTR